MYEPPSYWSDMTKAERIAWFNFHIDRVTRARGALVIAAEAYAKEVKACGAYERHNFKPDDLVSDVLDAADALLAEEVRDWMETIP